MDNGINSEEMMESITKWGVYDQREIHIIKSNVIGKSAVVLFKAFLIVDFNDVVYTRFTIASRDYDANLKALEILHNMLDYIDHWRRITYIPLPRPSLS